VHERQHPAGGEPARLGDHVLLGDPALDEPVGKASANGTSPRSTIRSASSATIRSSRRPASSSACP
jgi:hypothetical protein